MKVGLALGPDSCVPCPVPVRLSRPPFVSHANHRHPFPRHRSFVVLVTGTVVYGKGDEQAVAEEIAEGHYDADVEEPAATGAPHLPAVGSSTAMGIPAAAAGPSGNASGSIPISTSLGGSLKSTQNIGVFSGSLSRSLVRQRFTPPPRALVP